MNKNWILFTLIWTICSESTSQESGSVGVKGGMVQSKQADYEYRTGLLFGGYIRTATPNTMYTSAEVLYVQKGPGQVLPGDVDEASGDVDSYSPRADYLSIPFYVGWDLSSKDVSPLIYFGPRLDILLYSQDMADLKSLLFGMTFGVGLDIELGGETVFTIDGRVSPSFTPAYQEGGRKERNLSFELVLGYKIAGI